MSKAKPRCFWAKSNDLMIEYHDKQWGVAVHDNRLLFEMLNLEGAQAGLSWQTILNKRDGYKRAFDNFDVSKVAKYDDAKKQELLGNTSIVRNRLKISAVIDNARAMAQINKEFKDLNNYLWSFVDNQPLTNKDRIKAQKIGEDMSKDLKKRGFRFVGPTICYGLMQSTGMINDHQSDCFRYQEIEKQNKMNASS